MGSSMTFAAHTLARCLALQGHDYKSIVAIVRAAGFRIEASEASEMAERFNPPRVIAECIPADGVVRIKA